MVRKHEQLEGKKQVQTAPTVSPSLTHSVASQRPFTLLIRLDPGMECHWPLGKAGSLCIVDRFGFPGLILAAAPLCGMTALGRSKLSLGSAGTECGGDDGNNDNG